jgi:excisionase family DNA binding protein
VHHALCELSSPFSHAGLFLQRVSIIRTKNFWLLLTFSSKERQGYSMVVISGKEHITLVECAKLLGVSYRTTYAFMMAHSLPKQKIGRQYFVCYDDFSGHPRYVKRDREAVLV